MNYTDYGGQLRTPKLSLEEGGQLRTPKLSLEEGGQLRTPKLSLADAAGGTPLATLSLLLRFFLGCGFPETNLHIHTLRRLPTQLVKVNELVKTFTGRNLLHVAFF